MLLALLAVRLVDEFGGFLPTGAFESFRADLGLTYTQASAVLAAAAPGAIAGNVFSVLADHRSRRVIATGGALGFALALTMFGLAQSFPVLLLAGFAYGCAATAMVDPAEIALVDLTGDDAPAYISRSHFFGSIGDMLGPVAFIVADALGASWRAVFLGGAVLTTAYAMWIATLRFPPPHPEEHETTPAGGLRAVGRDRRVWFYGFLCLLLGPLEEPFVALLLSYLERVRGFSPGSATAVALAWSVGAMVALASTSRATYRPSDRALPRAAAIVAGAAVGCLALPWPLAIALCSAASGFGMCRFFVAVMARIIGIRPGQLGTVSAVVTTIEFVGFVFPLAAGAVADAHGVTAGLACYVGLALVLLVVVAVQARRERAI